MGHGIKNQLEQAVAACTVPGRSRHSDKHNSAVDVSWQIYSTRHGRGEDCSYESSLRQQAGQLGAWIKEHHPECRMVREITPGMLQEYLQTAADRGLQPDTLTKLASGIRKLEACCQHKFPASRIDWHTDELRTPDARSSGRLRVKTADEVTYERLLEAMPRTTEAYKSLILSRHAGLRVGETRLVHRSCVHFTGGAYGYGYIELRRGAIDGAKHGRSRTIALRSEADRDAIREICRGVQPEQTIVRKADGTPYAEESITKSIGRTMAKIGIDRQWLQNKNHSIRKLYAQECYDLKRVETQGMSRAESRRAAESFVCTQLGHGKNRAVTDRDLLTRYVSNTW